LLFVAKGLNVSFSEVKYCHIAPLVGLKNKLAGSDMKAFKIHRARIPTYMFKEIIQDVEIIMTQYGDPAEHQTKEAILRFLATVRSETSASPMLFWRLLAAFHRLLNRTVALLKSSIQNIPETIIMGRLTTKGRIEYHFRVFRGLSVLVIEVKLSLGTSEERRNAVAQVIAECDGV
jgi:hypothetical protein